MHEHDIQGIRRQPRKAGALRDFAGIYLPKLGFSPLNSRLSATVQGTSARQVTTCLDHGLLEVGSHRRGVVPRMGNKRGERDGTLGG